MTSEKQTIADLYRVPENGKAELIGGKVVLMAPTGDEPSRTGFLITRNLFEHEKRTQTGRAYPDNVGYRVQVPNRESFSPNASYFTGARSGLRFLQGAPLFAVEVRSENDYGPKAEEAIAQKRHDYFAAGTQVVWDVDLRGDDVVSKYVMSSPDAPVVFRWGEAADAEPALPGWTMPVDDLFF